MEEERREDEEEQESEETIQRHMNEHEKTKSKMREGDVRGKEGGEGRMAWDKTLCSQEGSESRKQKGRKRLAMQNMKPTRETETEE